MAVCNLFKTLGTGSNDGQGIFFTFSQYAEDLTKQQTLGEHYRVSPSKFACLNLTTDNAVELPEILQRLYENKVSYFRAITNDDEYQWKLFDASILLWNALDSQGKLTESGSGDTKYFEELKYIGDIDIYSNEVINGTNYSEIYCLVPPDAAATKYYNTTNSADSFTFTTAEQANLNGWASNYPTNGLQNLPLFDDSTNHTYTYGNEQYPLILSGGDLADDAQLSTPDIGSPTGFQFNTMILFYDIVDENNDIIYKNLPLGIWFSGGYNGTPGAENSLYNFVNKFTASHTVYGQGTSYGLRVCTKLIGTPFGTTNEVTVGASDGEYDSLNAVCEAFTETLNELDQVYEKLELNQNSMADYLNEFTSGKVNVPYIKEINGMYYWFINGRNTNVQTISGIKTLDTTAFTSQQTDANEQLIGDGKVYLHKIAKTGLYSDLIGALYIDNAPEYQTITDGGTFICSVPSNYRSSEIYISLRDYTLESNNAIRIISSANTQNTIYIDNATGIDPVYMDIFIGENDASAFMKMPIEQIDYSGDMYDLWNVYGSICIPPHHIMKIIYQKIGHYYVISPSAYWCYVEETE